MRDLRFHMFFALRQKEEEKYEIAAMEGHRARLFDVSPRIEVIFNSSSQ